MNIGIFDSGLGGLFIMRHIVKKLPQYNFVYLGDTKRVPYGNRSHETIFSYTCEALDFLFKKGCVLVILACNSASAQGLRQIQQEWLPKKYPNRKVLGVIIPTVEAALLDNPKKIGILATQGTVGSNTFVKEINKRNRHVRILQQAAPLLVPLVESGELKHARTIIRSYLAPLKQIDSIILGCTHYGILAHMFRKELRPNQRIISQNTIIPDKLAQYLGRHPEIEKKLTTKRKLDFFVTEITPTNKKMAARWFGKHIILRKASYTD